MAALDRNDARAACCRLPDAVHRLNVDGVAASEEAIMRRSLTLLCVLACYTATPDTARRSAETFGEWSSPINVGPPVNTEYNDNVRDPVPGRIDDVLHLGSSRWSRRR